MADRRRRRPTATADTSGRGRAPRGRQPRPSTRRRTRAAASPARRRRRGGVLWVALGSLVLVGLLFAFVYPTRTFLDQRQDTQRAREQLELLRDENARLADEAERLQSPHEVEKRAREFGLVKPGEQGFVIVPTPTTPTTPAAAAPPASTTAPTGNTSTAP